jgi:hypothetical protein
MPKETAMNIRQITLASILAPGLALTAAAHGPAHNPGHGPGPGHPPHGSNDVLTPRANRLAGMWTTDIHASPAGCTPGTPRPPLTGRNTMVFNAGGTLVENPLVTPPGVPGAVQLRSFGIGTWSYDVRTDQYRAVLRFDWYSSADGSHLGYQVVERSMLLSNDLKKAFGPVTSTRYAPDGSLVAKVCGEAVSSRL